LIIVKNQMYVKVNNKGITAHAQGDCSSVPGVVESTGLRVDGKGGTNDIFVLLFQTKRSYFIVKIPLPF